MVFLVKGRKQSTLKSIQKNEKRNKKTINL